MFVAKSSSILGDLIHQIDFNDSQPNIKEEFFDVIRLPRSLINKKTVQMLRMLDFRLIGRDDEDLVMFERNLICKEILFFIKNGTYEMKAKDVNIVKNMCF